MRAKDLGKSIAKMKAMTRGTTPMPHIKSVIDETMGAAKASSSAARQWSRRVASRPLRGDIYRKVPPEEHKIPRIYLHGSTPRATGPRGDPGSTIERKAERPALIRRLQKSISGIFEKKPAAPTPAGPPSLSIVS
jgi:hypothetical protein